MHTLLAGWMSEDDVMKMMVRVQGRGSVCLKRVDVVWCEIHCNSANSSSRQYPFVSEMGSHSLLPTL
jgi:hypothetical protein